MSSLVMERKARAYTNRVVWRKAQLGAKRDGTSLAAELNRVISRYAAVADRDCDEVRALHALPTDTVLRNESDWDAFAHEMGLDD